MLLLATAGGLAVLWLGGSAAAQLAVYHSLGPLPLDGRSGIDLVSDHVRVLAVTVGPLGEGVSRGMENVALLTRAAAPLA